MQNQSGHLKASMPFVLYSICPPSAFSSIAESSTVMPQNGKTSLI
jgi:hypothetical protein